ncbi:MAG: hypothetical protein GC145_01350 [Caulobacter sp.]|nr:hypothetical protein [Caulobacter sp.]
MVDIRPTPWTPAQTPATTPGRSAAQRAFFDAAMGRTPPAAAPTRPLAETRSVRPAAPPATPTTQVHSQPAGQADGETPRKILRPGSLVDIRV